MSKLDRYTALEVFKDFSQAMRPSYNLYGTPELSISREDFEKFRKKYLDDTKEASK